MAGAVAMASVIEDFETPPCKKVCKDGSTPVAKTITNYFSPIPKPVEKTISPPRSNNIMDYFSRVTPFPREKTSTPEQSKENCQLSKSSDKAGGIEATVKQPPRKRGRNTSKARRSRALKSSDSVGEESCYNVEEPTGSSVSTSGFHGSDTAALLAQLCADDYVTTNSSPEENAGPIGNAEVVQEDGCRDDVFNCGNCGQLRTELDCPDSLREVNVIDKTKHPGPAPRNYRKRHRLETKHSSSEEYESEKSFCDLSMEVNVGDESQLNNSTVTISFEDFVRSQSHSTEDEGTDEKPLKADSHSLLESEDKDPHNLDMPYVDSMNPSFNISPQTLTVQAEVHTILPKQETSKVVGNIASIFTKTKGAVEKTSSPCLEAGHHLSSTSPTHGRKSNVVVQEVDLEIAVVESECTPKCSAAEKKQFLAAFKQAGGEGSKSKSGKNQGKQKEPRQKPSDTVDGDAEKDGASLSVSEPDSGVSTKKTVKEKKASQTRRGRKKALTSTESPVTRETVIAEINKDTGDSAITLPPPARRTRGRKKAIDKKPSLATSSISPTASDPGNAIHTQDNTEDLPITSPSSAPTLRRSTRDAVLRQVPGAAGAKPVQRRRGNDATTMPMQDDTVNVSTPRRRKAKHGAFVAEILSPADKMESPIRIKFTRIRPNIPVSTTITESADAPLGTLVSDASKKRKKAKKLVEKAKVIQQCKKTVAERKSTLRCSSRMEDSHNRSHCDDEDLVMCVNDSNPPIQIVQEMKLQKPLRSLHDVLGKATPIVKDIKSPSGSQLSQEKRAGRAVAVVSIFDESSREGSENSQDDEQFRARREFLRSGLPESFRKYVAKAAATKEAYSLSCSNFQPVVHMQQPPKDCCLWSLPWPESSSLCHLRELWSQTSFSTPSLLGSFCHKTQPACRTVSERSSGWKPEISESVRQLLMEEIHTLNPTFPAQTFLARFLKRRTDLLQQCTSSVGIKRKRIGEGEVTKLAKKHRPIQSNDNMSATEPTKNMCRSSRALRRRSKEENKKVKATCTEEDYPIVIDDVDEDTETPNVMMEDTLWTDKYLPQQSSEVIGNNLAIRRLHSWLKEWKLRTDREEKKEQREKCEDGSADSDWDCGEQDTRDGEDTLCNTLLITGPTGVGKTAAVYACAMELGFKVFEVNASSQRSGRLILSQLKEATQSHQVDTSGAGAYKPTYFNTFSASSSSVAVKTGVSPRKINCPRRVFSSPRKRPQSPRGPKRGLAPTSLANFFKSGRPTSKEPSSSQTAEQIDAAGKTPKANEAIKTEDLSIKSTSATFSKERRGEEDKKTPTSLILFEEVDVNFDEDLGFLAAIKMFMTTTKRPVILTTSDPAFSTMFDGNFEEINFDRPSLLDVGSYLQLLCLAEDMRIDLHDVCSLLTLNCCDIRQSMLQLQFWGRSAGGHCINRPLRNCHGNGTPQHRGEAVDSSVCTPELLSALPPCDTGCTESMLGLLNIVPQQDLLEIFKRPSDDAVTWDLLLDSRQRGVDLLYSNIEILLPLPVGTLTLPTYKPQRCGSVPQDRATKEESDLPSSSVQSGHLPNNHMVPHKTDAIETSDDGSPVKVSNRMKRNKRRCCLTEQGKGDSDSDDSFVSLHKPESSAERGEGNEDVVGSERVSRKKMTPEDLKTSLPVSHCLESMADFLDHMSFLDSSLIVNSPLEVGGRHRNMFPGCAELKDGMTDEPRVECDRWRQMRRDNMLEIQAAVEVLSFQECQAGVKAAWTRIQQLDGELKKEAAAQVTLPVTPHQKHFSFSQAGPCPPHLIQQRKDVMENLMSRGRFSNMGIRSGASLDYLPVLRNICRWEQLKEQGKVKRRFLHYLDAINLGLEKSTLQHLAEDFP